MVNKEIKLLGYIVSVHKSSQNFQRRISGYIKYSNRPKNSKRGGKHNLKKFSGKLILRNNYQNSFKIDQNKISKI